jgi:hypothetical protein
MSEDEHEWPLELPVGKCARLAYGPDFKHDDLLLLEMDEAILQEALVDGCVITGSPTWRAHDRVGPCACPITRRVAPTTQSR